MIDVKSIVRQVHEGKEPLHFYELESIMSNGGFNRTNFGGARQKPGWRVIPATNSPAQAEHIGIGTHHRIVFDHLLPSNGDPEFAKQYTNNALNSVSKHLHEKGIKHERSQNEWGVDTIYVPKDQSDQVTENFDSSDLWQVMKGSLVPRVEYQSNRIYPKQPGWDFVPANWNEHTKAVIGGETHHRIIYMGAKYDQTGPDKIKHISQHLTSKNVEHEISNDEHGKKTIYVPVAQKGLYEALIHDKKTPLEIEDLHHLLLPGRNAAKEYRNVFRFRAAGSYGNSFDLTSGKTNETHIHYSNHKKSIGYGSHHKIVRKNAKKTDVQKVVNHLNSIGIKHEVGVDERGKDAIYVPIDQSDHITEAIEQSIGGGWLAQLLKKNRIGQYLQTSTYHQAGFTINGIGGTPYDEKAIGHGTHHIIKRKESPDDHYPADDRWREANMQQIMTVLKNNRIKHEYGKDEKGESTIYVPHNQTQVNEGLVPDKTKPLSAKDLEHLLFHTPTSIGKGKIVQGKTTGVIPADWFPESIGGDTHHRISLWTSHRDFTSPPYDETGHGKPRKENQNKYIKQISDHLKELKVKHEISDDEHSVPSIYVPVDQRSKITEAKNTDFSAHHLYLALSGGMIGKNKLVPKALNPYSTAGVSSIKRGGYVIHPSRAHRSNSIYDDNPQLDNMIGAMTHHRVTYVTSDLGSREPTDQEKLKLKRMAMRVISRHLSAKKVQHEISQDETGEPTIYVPLNQTISEAIIPIYDKVARKLLPIINDHNMTSRLHFWAADNKPENGRIGAGTHHIITQATIPSGGDKYSEDEEAGYERRFQSMRDRLDKEGIKHEYGREELGRRAIYVPIDQGVNEHYITRNYLNDVLYQHLHQDSIVVRLPSEAEHWEGSGESMPIGADIGYRIHAFKRFNDPEEQHKTLRHVSRDLADNGIKHEIANDEAGRPTVYVPSVQNLHEETYSHGYLQDILHPYNRDYHQTSHVTLNEVEPQEGWDAVGLKPHRIGITTHHRIRVHKTWDNADIQKATVEKVRADLLKRNIEHEFSHDEEGVPTFYVPAYLKPYLNHVTEAAEASDEIKSINKSYSKLDSLFYDNYPGLKRDYYIRSAWPTDDNIGGTTHHKIHPNDEPAKHSIKQFLSDHNIEHEKSKDEYGNEHFYIPWNQKALTEGWKEDYDLRNNSWINLHDILRKQDVVKEPVYSSAGGTGHHRTTPIWSVQQAAQPLSSEQYAGLSNHAKSIQDAIGATTHHRVRVYKYPNETQNPDEVNFITNHLSAHNVQHEVSQDEGNRLSIFVPIDQEALRYNQARIDNDFKSNGIHL